MVALLSAMFVSAVEDVQRVVYAFLFRCNIGQYIRTTKRRMKIQHGSISGCE